MGEEILTCAYRQCTFEVIEDAAYCQRHILNSRFATKLGYRQCAYKNTNGKRCRRPVKVSPTDLKEGLKDSDLADANEKIQCGRHQLTKSPNPENENRMEDHTLDCPDSDPEQPKEDHPLASSKVLSKREILQVLKSKVDRLRKLYIAELDRKNKQLYQAGRTGRLDFLKHSLTGNEYIVAQMAKTERYQVYRLQGDKVPDESKHRCNFDDCWKTAIPLTDYCKEHIDNPSNRNIPCIYKDLPDDFQFATGDFDPTKVEEQKRRFTELAEKADFQSFIPKRGRGVFGSSAMSSMNSSRASTPSRHFLDASSEDMSGPGTPNGLFLALVPPKADSNGVTHMDTNGTIEMTKDILGADLFNPETTDDESQPNAITKKEEIKPWRLSESDDSDQEIKSTETRYVGPIQFNDGPKLPFEEGGIGNVLQLGGLRYDIKAENPIIDPTTASNDAKIAIEVGKKGKRPVVVASKVNTSMRILPGAQDRTMMIAPNNFQLPPGQTAIQIPMSQFQSLTGGQIQGLSGDKNQVFTLINSSQLATQGQLSAQVNSAGQMLIPLTAIAQPVQMPQAITPATSKSKARGQTKSQKLKAQNQANAGLKLVNVDFFGAQEPRQRKPSGGTLKTVPSALERLAKKAEEKQNAIVASPALVQPVGSTQYGQLTPKSAPSTPKLAPASTTTLPRTNIKLVKSKLSSLESATTVDIPQAQASDSDK